MLSLELGKCFEGCGTDSLCLLDCTSDFETALKDCPCQEGCPDGCPCPNWDCDAAIPSQVLILEFEAVKLLINTIFSAMTSMTMTTGIDVKMVLQLSLANALIHVAEIHHASSNAVMIMKPLS